MSATQRLGASVHLRTASRDDRTIDIVASDFSRDSYDTRIDPNGWDLTQFVKNPVILAFHNDYKFPVARALPDTIRSERGELLMRIQFPEKGKYPEADIAFDLYADGFMRGVSVGFVPLEWEDVEEGEGDNRRSIRVYRKAKLLEVSLVPIPSNDNALAQRAADLNHDAEDIKQRTEELEKLLDERSQHVETLSCGDIQIDVRVSDLEAFKAFKEEFEKRVTYFDEKQRANRASTKALEKFYKRVLKEEQPANELDAWNRMAEVIDVWNRMAEAIDAMEEPKVEQVTEVSEEVIAEVVEEPTPPIEPAEAPQAAPEAPVQLSLDVLAKLPGAIAQACTDAVVKASRQGVPPGEWDPIIEAAGHQFLKALSPNSPR